MVNKICLDTDFLVNLLRGKKEELEYIKNHEDAKELATTPINMFELYYGANKSEKSKENLKAVDLLLESLDILNLSSDSMRKSGEILAELEKKGELIDFRDLLIGVVALVNGYSVKTNNIKHFSKIKGLDIL